MRSSWAASATNPRCRVTDRSRAARVSFVVPASSATSSRVPGTGTRRVRSPEAVISASSPRIAATGRSARRVTSQVTAATTASSRGSPASIARPTAATASRVAVRAAPA
ncbi:hypothetical protein LUX73_14505 [Actinomadura madurae]|nr:hypothetical protein [Actinomadura madurae]MCQ0005758.1 hypothetical protein [Actinomadura madurae]